MRIHNISHKPQTINNKQQKSQSDNDISFKSQYVVDGSSAVSRSQVFILGGLMCSHWVLNARETSNKARYNNVYGKLNMEVNEVKSPMFEKILQYNNITFQKVDPKSGEYNTFSMMG